MRSELVILVVRLFACVAPTLAFQLFTGLLVAFSTADA